MRDQGQTGDYLDVADFAGSDSMSDEAEEQVAGQQRRRPGLAAAGLIAAATLVLGLAAFCALGARQRGNAAHGGTTSGDVAPRAISLRAAAEPQTDTLIVAANGVALAAANHSKLSGLHLVSSLKPDEDLQDGNLCQDSEEQLGGLCYKKCRLLTMGEAPIRTSPWTCCEKHPCGLTNQRGRIGTTIACDGYDVSGSGGCPHRPGACLKNEEIFLGVCYKQCIILTEGEYPNRVAPASCCKANGITCMDVFYHDKTSAAFDVGGGKGDRDPSTPATPHLPSVELTEEGGAAAARARAAAAAAAAGAREPQQGAVPNLGSDAASLKPSYDLHDGNACQDLEEPFGGLCYKKCSLLTGGENPIRTSPWTCCHEHPCGLHNQKGTIGHEILCDGYDISADGSCPHKPGACLDDEEIFLGICYKKCSILTSGKFIHRVTPVSCCTRTGVDCFDFTKTRSRLTYAVGGGKGDNDPSTPKFLHLPQASLTEEVN
jgi:hypothetical protein